MHIGSGEQVVVTTGERTAEIGESHSSRCNYDRNNRGSCREQGMHQASPLCSARLAPERHPVRPTASSTSDDAPS